MSKTSADPVRYEIEGLYPVGPVAWLMKQDPASWNRDWRRWHWTTDLREARQTMRTGLYLCHRTCPISYTRLRLVRVDAKGRKVIK